MTSAEELSGNPNEAAHSNADSGISAGSAAVEMVQLPNVSNYIPTRIERCLQSVVLDKHGRMLLTASNLTGRYWTGSMWYYKAGETGPFTNNGGTGGVSKDSDLIKKCVTGVELDDGVGDALLFGDCGDANTMKANVLVACDNGSLDHLKLTQLEEGGAATDDKQFYLFDRVSTYSEHRDSITGMAKSSSSDDQDSSGGNLVTCSADGSIVAWDLKTMGVTARYPRAHGDQALDVTFVDAASVFASCSQDGLVALWDIREKGNRGVIREDVDAFPTCVEHSGDNYLIVGDVAGGVHLLDMRKPASEAVASATEALSGHRIHRIELDRLHQKQSPNRRLAVCGDSTVVRVLDVKDNSRFIQRYEDFRHTDFVRGLAWGARDTLWSCGWDMQVLRHHPAAGDNA